MEQKKVLEAYAYSILAKDAAGRYSNPRRALRSFEDIMEVAQGTDNKQAFGTTMATAIADAIANTNTNVQTPVDRTAKDFYSFKKDQHSMNKRILDKLDALAPKVPATP